MRTLVKQILEKLHLLSLARMILSPIRLFISLFRKKVDPVKQKAIFDQQKVIIDKQIINSYLNQNNIRKLHIGCGNNILEGWLNSDYHPHSKTIIHIDATKPFPFEDKKLDYIFSEHMIEHLTFPEGSIMLAECFRVLKENGKIRISTPDLAFLINLYKEDKSDIQKKYIKWSIDSFLKSAPYYSHTFIINNFVRDWGHLFIYDEHTLRLSMEKAGFTNITKCDINQSDDELLKNLENDKRMPDGFLKLESFTLEGTKPRL